MTSPDERYMALALSLGRRGQGMTWPNPAVGCVVVREGRVVGRGWTQPGGRPHAETEALAQAGEAARGATAYVSLEPCAHQGRTPPCAQALIDAGVARVVAAVEDSDARVAGQGFAMLRAAGITVDTGVLDQQAMRDHAGFFLRTEQGRPLVTLKLASSFDGRIATATGQSKWITGPQARRAVHAMRARHDAVMVGAGTARADDPPLTVRDLGVAQQPVRVVVSRHLDLPLMSQLARSAAEHPVWLCHGPGADHERMQAWEGLGAKLIPCAVHGTQLDAGDLLQQLGAAGLTRVFCEGGSALAASLLADDLVDEFVGFGAGLAIGAEGLPAIGAMGLDRLEDAPRFTLSETHQIGADILHRWTRALK
ncbi:bifunctional diaminohydroxyphosphoribosylaminopyrimidine deaminase/5-amino-6-(5-phosphoribosylamino)uracil reductase RibD [Ruegeria sp. 2205SS24-7]|uniref:bifunctional diaminohydroxyphosphoribosylaminopyrimidine deaminase/5-amino-6-(5-phosphoribosylamino)uracil reductase RibD n=1 Tax=Ruegeria discodermiae TaxID=3064389 RepID=UPI002741904B|nr:bifunctional diaminohydroxyphosphoribosylaminopyrimidine deaminase/5-amino-6-(5-phosphoribosylamino)uracil reductase RibD [Ruegeria sp. 2205SS24-7]MDP5216624.1 bifunctional diaminohydroxyphosphoribosylaminopyrimidine deaminase/5-amino-6-(5-phosphoribosylamino)uracil reductase RibD [Ruegeria sp. 2205SS24-7]